MAERRRTTTARLWIAGALGNLWAATAGGPPGAVAVVAVCRLGSAAPTGEDLAWHDVVLATARSGAVRCAGVYLQTPGAARRIAPRAA